MTERQKELIRLALIYAISNLDDLIEAFGDGSELGTIDANGEDVPTPTEDEFDELMKEYQ